MPAELYIPGQSPQEAVPNKEVLRGRVAVVGIGWVFPLGNTIEEGWKNMVDGKNGIRSIRFEDFPQITANVAGVVDNFSPEEDLKGIVPSNTLPFLHRSSQFVLKAGHNALLQAGIISQQQERIGSGTRMRTVWKINDGVVSPEDVCTVVATGIGGAADASVSAQKMLDLGKMPSAEFVFNALPGRVATVPSMAFGMQGGVGMVDAECASGNYAIGEGRRKILNGEATVAFVGGTESTMTPVGFALFNSLGALSTEKDPNKAPHALDVHNSGFAYAEGAAVMILEDVDHARRRGANIIAYVSGYGESGDAYHESFPRPDGKGQERAMRHAIESAGGFPKKGVIFWSGHLTGTGGDKEEIKVIKRVAGDSLPRVFVSGSKPEHGHPLGASGVIESVKAVLAVKHGIIPPIIKTEVLVAEAEGANVVVGESIEAPVTMAVVDSFGFGGPNAITVFEKA